MMRQAIALIFLSTWLASPTARGNGLAWDVTSIHVAAKPGQSVLYMSFPFRNAGKATVNLVSVEPSCRCVAAQADKASYAPGERGAVEASFAIVGQTGVAEKTILVTTDDAPMNPVRLEIRVDIPKAPPPRGSVR